MRSLILASVAVGCLGLGCRRHPPAPERVRPPASQTEVFPSPHEPVVQYTRPIASSAVVTLERSRVQLSVTETNIRLLWPNPGMRTFNYESWAEWTFRNELTGEGAAQDRGPECVREIKATPVAWIAPLLGLREEILQSCPREAHPGGETRLTTLALDLDRHSQGPPRPLVLTDLFEPAVVYEALRHDDLVVKALHGSDIPAELGALVKALADTPPVVDGKHCYSFPSDLLARFVLHHSEGTHVAVRVGLPGAGPCRYELTELGLLLRMPEALKPALEHMGEGTGSFFVADRPNQAKTAVVHVTARAPE